MSKPIPRVDPRFIGTEALTDEDRHYQGSRFQEVRDAIFANPYYSTWGAVGETPLPSNRASKGTGWIFGMKSWPRFTTKGIRNPSAT